MSVTIAVVKNDFIITTSDLAVTYFKPNEEIYKETGRIEPSNKKIKTNLTSKKTHKVSDKVILISTGYNVITETLLVELNERVKKDADLHEVRVSAKEVMRNIKKGKVNNLDTILNRLKEEIPYLKDNPDLVSDYWATVLDLIDHPKGLSAYLVGFGNDGISGLVDIKANSMARAHKDTSKGYPALVAGEGLSDEYHEAYLKSLILPEDNRKIGPFMEAMGKIHAHISYTKKG